MKRIVVFLSASVAFANVTIAAWAASAPTAAAQLCADKLENETLKYVNAVQQQIRLSLKKNVTGTSSACSGGYVCAGGTLNGHRCTGNVDCPSGECDVATGKGIAGSINRAKRAVRKNLAKFCTAGDLSALGMPNSRCPAATTAATVADCVLRGAIGDIGRAVFGDAAGEILGRAAPSLVPQATDPTSLCGVALASVFQFGSESAAAADGEAGAALPLALSCAGSNCTTSGLVPIGNRVSAPLQTYAGAIPICLVVTANDAGNGTSESGSIDLVTGEQSSLLRSSMRMLVGTLCPLCDAATSKCDSGPNVGNACSQAGATDVACPPTIAGGPVVFTNPLDLSTEAHTLSVPANNPAGGQTNPNAAFCGACSLDKSIGCQNDADCIAASACGGAVGSGCCQFGTNTGAFGVDSATTATANGVRGPYLPKLATIFCQGKSGDGLLDATLGLPGPARLLVQQLNAFAY